MLFCKVIPRIQQKIDVVIQNTRQGRDRSLDLGGVATKVKNIVGTIAGHSLPAPWHRLLWVIEFQASRMATLPRTFCANCLDHCPHTSSCGLLFGKIQRGAHKRGLKPQIFRENREEILPGKSGLFGANWHHFRAGQGLFGADRDQFLFTPQPQGKSRNCPERALFGPIAPFRAKPPFAKPPFGFSRAFVRDTATIFLSSSAFFDKWKEQQPHPLNKKTH